MWFLPCPGGIMPRRVVQILGLVDLVVAETMFSDFAEHIRVYVLAVNEPRLLPFEEIGLEMARDVAARFKENDLPVVVIEILL